MNKYKVAMQNIEMKTVDVFAANPHDAAAAAEVDGYCAIIVGHVQSGTIMDEFVVVGKCEGCRKTLFDSDDYRRDYEGVELCFKCWQELVSERLSTEMEERK